MPAVYVSRQVFEHVWWILSWYPVLCGHTPEVTHLESFAGLGLFAHARFPTISYSLR